MSRNNDRQPDAMYNRMHLFLIRVWHEPGVDGTVEWHGKLQRVVSGENRAFHGLAGLTDLLEDFLPTKKQPRLGETDEQRAQSKTEAEGDQR